MKKHLDRIMNIMGELELLISGILFGVIVCIMFLQIFSRYLLRNPLIWPEELSIMLMVWMVYIGASYTLKKKRHLSLDFVMEKIPVKIAKWIYIGTDLVVVVFLVYTIRGAWLLQPLMARNTTVALRIPTNYYTMAVIVGGILMALYLIYDLSIRLVGLSTQKRGESIAE